MRTINRDIVIYALENANLDSEGLREDYSGRGMYGDTCFGFVTNDYGSSFAFFVQLGIVGAQNEEQSLDDDSDYFDTGEAELLANSARTDAMGHSTIVYFPGWSLSD